MMAASVTEMDRQMRLIDKLVLLAALAIAVGVFLTIGWMALAPDDPRGAVSLIAHRHPVLMVAQSVLLVAVTAAIATVMIGGKLPDVGVFATGMGLALASLHGNTSTYLLIRFAGEQRELAAEMLLESLVWSGVMGVGLVVGGLVMHWCRDSFYRAADDEQGSDLPRALSRMAISECPGLSRLVGAKALDGGALVAGLRTTGVVTAAALLLYSTLVSGSAPLTIRHGQICFATFAAFYVGSWIARRLFPSRTAFWPLLAVPLTCLIGYAWTMVQRGSVARGEQWASIPASDFLRALPMTFVAVGALGVLAAHWMIEPAMPRTKVESKPRDAQRKRAKR